jgi:hypothetical protein
MQSWAVAVGIQGPLPRHALPGELLGRLKGKFFGVHRTPTTVLCLLELWFSLQRASEWVELVKTQTACSTLEISGSGLWVWHEICILNKFPDDASCWVVTAHRRPLLPWSDHSFISSWAKQTISVSSQGFSSFLQEGKKGRSLGLGKSSSKEHRGYWETFWLIQAWIV